MFLCVCRCTCVLASLIRLLVHITQTQHHTLGFRTVYNEIFKQKPLSGSENELEQQVTFLRELSFIYCVLSGLNQSVEIVIRVSCTLLEEE